MRPQLKGGTLDGRGAPTSPGLRWRRVVAFGVIYGVFRQLCAQFRVADIDRPRSSKVHLFGGRTIWSRTGAAIYLDPITVPKAGRLEVLRALDLVQAG